MDHLLQGMFGEKSLTKVAGIYTERDQADAMVGRALRLPGMQRTQVRLLGPQDARASRCDLVARSLEPEQAGIFRTLVRSHLVTGIAGAVVGVLFYAWLLRGGQPMVAGSPLLAFVAIVGFATTFGLMAGGLVTLRPDHIRLISQVRSSLRAGYWAVVIHPTDSHQALVSQDLLQGSGAEKVISTL